MVLVSYSGREINAKIVFYGPALCGKTTNLEYIYGSIPSQHRGKMVSMKTKTERTLFFDFLPLNLGELAGFKTRFLLYTVPGQVYYNATRKLVLKGADAIVFVADSQRGKMEENIESFQNLRDNLSEHGLSLDEIPYVIQYNKRDLPKIYSVHELETALNKENVPSFEAVATTGVGVFETFKSISKLLLARLSGEIGATVVKQDETVWPKEQKAESDVTQSHPEAPQGQPASSVAPGTETAHPTAADAPIAANSKEMPVVQPSIDGLVQDVSKDGLAADGLVQDASKDGLAAKAIQPVEADGHELAAAKEVPVSRLSDGGPAPDVPEDGAAGKRGSQDRPRGLWRWLRKDEQAMAADREILEAPRTPSSAPAPPVEQEETPRTCASPELKPPPAADAPDRVKADSELTTRAPERGVAAPQLAKVSRSIEVQQQEILVPVLIPRSTVGDRVILRIDLRFVQDLDPPQESSGTAPASEEVA
ncbi:MAG: hypothetical protein KAY24_06160 [Candidatus Eisenbacteria sp.]|nr:hypothetical protein [Candidatus Eisenbacteria bacterium]